jgi:hypothetical protein
MLPATEKILRKEPVLELDLSGSGPGVGGGVLLHLTGGEGGRALLPSLTQQPGSLLKCNIYIYTRG